VTRSRRARAFFDGLADRYHAERYGARADPWRACFFGGRLAKAREMLEGVRGLVLDLGAGPGVLAEALADLPVTVVSVDLSAAMLAESKEGGVAADALRLPFPAASVDAVAALGLTTYLDGLGRFLAEARRVLRPGGRLLFSIARRESIDGMIRAGFRRLLAPLAGRRRVLGSGLALRSFSEGETRRALRARGFRVLRTARHNFTVFPVCYLARGPSVAIGRRLEERGGPGPLASDALLLAERADRPRPRRRIRVVRAIARLNVGGPARQAILLTARLDPRRYESTLVTGTVSEGEGDMLDAARAAGLDPVVLPELGRAVSPLSDLRAFLGLLRVLLRIRPHVLHTHTAKAGALGRIAGLLAGVPVRIHTFHGHVLSGYFGPAGSALVRAAELVLSRTSTRIVAVSPEVARDLTHRHRVAPRSKVAVVPLGLDLDPLFDTCRTTDDGTLRVGTVGRLVPVKEPGLLVETARRVLREMSSVRFAVVGGGELLARTRESVRALGLEEAVDLPGWRDDLERVYAGFDLALLTSRNEGTPVALIEAAAAGVPAVATRVGGVPSVVEDGVTGLLVPPGDPEALAEAVLALLRDPERRKAMGRAARDRATRFRAERLLGDIDGLYRVCLRRRSS
jgi:glycosyltransferase involved in cell wall biosynthesis